LRPDQLEWLDAKGLGKTIDHIDARGINAALNGADIGPVNIRTMRKLLLRQVLCLS
jgi:hypothetical protein